MTRYEVMIDIHILIDGSPFAQGHTYHLYFVIVVVIVVVIMVAVLRLLTPL